VTPILFYDTETTGLPIFDQPSDHPDQPHIVQLAALLVDADTRNIINSMDVIIRPNGWSIPDEASKVHGITTEHAADVGIAEKVAADMILQLWGGNRLRVAHNEQFDARIVRIALNRFVDDPHDVFPCSDLWKSGKAECTARLATPICALPPTERMRAARRFHHKTPNLGEAYRHFTGKELENAHSALEDVQACMAIYFAIKDQA